MHRVVVLFVLVATSAGCMIGPTDTAGCGTSSAASAQCISPAMRADAKSVASWSAFGTDHGASLVGAGQPCTLEWMPALQTLPRDGSGTVDSTLFIACANGDAHFEFVLSGLGDPRTWPDTHTLPGPCLLGSGLDVSGGGASCGERSVCGATVTITTEAHTGAATTTSSFVTPDYARTFRIDIDATHPRLTSCSAQAIAFSAHIWLTQTAADWAPHDCPVMCE